MNYEAVRESADYILSKLKGKTDTGIILGSGLGGLVDVIEDPVVIPYGEIPHFPKATLAGHAGNFVFGKIGGRRVAVMQGRFHCYQGLGMDQVTYPLYVMKLLGVSDRVITNACGGIRKDFRPGDLMIITDFINMLGTNPLIGDNDERFGVRFPDMSEPYSHELIALAEKCAASCGISYQKGVYLATTGPSYVTAAESRAFRTLGADAVGMSTVPETIVARYLGMKVLGIACITNMATGLAREPHTHEEVLRIADESSARLCRWVTDILKA